MMYKIVVSKTASILDHFYVLDQNNTVIRASTNTYTLITFDLESMLVECDKHFGGFMPSNNKIDDCNVIEVLRFDRDIPISEQYPEYFI